MCSLFDYVERQSDLEEDYKAYVSRMTMEAKHCVDGVAAVLVYA